MTIGHSIMPASDESLVGLIYEAAAGVAGWGPFLDALARRCDAHGVTLFEHDFHRATAKVFGALGVDPAMQRSYEQHYAAGNPWVLAQQGMPAGSIVLSHELVPAEVLRRNECFQEWHRPQGFDFAIGSNIEVRFGAMLKLGVLRNRAAGPMNANHVRLFSALMPHLKHSLLLSQQRRRLDRQAAAMQAFAEISSTAAMVLDRRHRVLQTNPAADSILQRCDAFAVDVHGVLQLCDGEADARWRAWLGQMAMAPADPRQLQGMRVRRLSGRRPYWVEAKRLGHAAGEDGEPLGDDEANLLLCIRDPERLAGIDAALVEAALGLSPAEAQLASGLAQGLSLKEVAVALALDEAAVRSLTRKLLAKTGCLNQMELVRWVVSLSH